MNKYLQEAIAIRESIKGLASVANDETIINNKAAFPFWNGNGISYSVDDILQYTDGEIYKVIQPHTSQLDWPPDQVPALFKKISLEEYPEWVQPTGGHDAYNKDDKCAHNNKHWASDIDGNVWEPGVYGWREL